jgi:hypothetical protein
MSKYPQQSIFRKMERFGHIAFGVRDTGAFRFSHAGAKSAPELASPALLRQCDMQREAFGSVCRLMGGAMG